MDGLCSLEKLCILFVVECFIKVNYIQLVVFFESSIFLLIFCLCFINYRNSSVEIFNCNFGSISSFSSVAFWLPSIHYTGKFGGGVFFLGRHPQHMEVPRLRVQAELQLPAYATATATADLSRACNLIHSSCQCGIPNPLIEAQDQTCILMDAGQICSTESRRELQTGKI